jgi:DNA-binding winged helix-turn-helix (wHTH) protein
MHYRFNEFEFDSIKLLLTKNGDALGIRYTEAKVLAVLLEKTDTVLSKDDILSHVWHDKIVSEQVIFQNISNLRNLFGNNAIKTFPKRGYQWQLKVEVFSSVGDNTSDSHNAQNISDSLLKPASLMPKKAHSLWQFAVLACILFFGIAAIFSQSKFQQEKPVSVIKLAYIPITNLDDEVNAKGESITFADNAGFDLTELPHLDTEAFRNSIEIEYPKLSRVHPYILTGKIRTAKQQTYLDFMIKGPSSDWEGQLSGPSKKDVLEQLQQHLKQQFIFDLISNPQSPELKLAKLSIAHQASLFDLITLLKLGSVYYKTDQLEKAMTMTDKLINVAGTRNNSQHMGRALLFQSKILRKKKLYDLSSQKLKLAIKYFEEINDLEHQSQAWYNQSLLYHEQRNYPAVKASLLKAAQLAYMVKNKPGEIEALITLVALANNYQNDNDKYLYLQIVEDKMGAYSFPAYHFAEISYRYATFAKTLSEKEPHLKQVLKLSTLTPEHWAAQYSRRQLVQHYITQNRFLEAQTLIESVHSDNGNNSYLKALMAQAKQQKSEVISHAQRTFEQAQLAGDRSLSLSAAKILCSEEVNCAFYSQYINDNTAAYQ